MSKRNDRSRRSYPRGAVGGNGVTTVVIGTGRRWIAVCAEDPELRSEGETPESCHTHLEELVRSRPPVASGQLPEVRVRRIDLPLSTYEQALRCKRIHDETGLSAVEIGKRLADFGGKSLAKSAVNHYLNALKDGNLDRDLLEAWKADRVPWNRITKVLSKSHAEQRRLLGEFLD